MLLVFHLSTCCQGICYPGFNLDSVKLHTTKLLKTQWLTGQSFRLSMNYHSFKPSRALPMMERSTCLQSWEDETHDFTVGPLAGDLAEIEALCRLQRLAEQLHKVVMDSLRRLDDEGTVNEEIALSSSLEEVVVAGLACVGATLHQGRLDILNGSSEDKDERLPRLARFRSKLRGCCKSLRTSLQSLIPTKGEENLAVHRTLQRLMNLCLDAGYFRPDGAPLHGYIPNFAAVKLRTDDSLVEFWRSGQVTEEGLEWLLRNEFKTIVDIRDEVPEDEMAESAMMEAEASGKIRRIKIPVQVETAPTMEQVREFAKIVAEPSNKPLLLQSYAGVIRPSAMVSRWREFVRRGGLECEEEECEVEDLWMDSSSDEVSRVNGDETKSNIAKATPSISPFQSQVPVVEDVFSRKHMSRFFKSKRMTPSTLFSQRHKQKVVVKYFDDQAPSDNGGLMAGNDTASERRLSKSSSNGGMRSSSQGNDVDAEVDMCASKTGVVRLQSRKKAEMYLVRADGFSCTRERVTESTLAFTHPSTQQQMLMWKTAPKTVLILKKLGDELMEEAKLVASFLHEQEEMNVMVEPELHDRFARYPGFGYVQTFYNHDIGELHERVDFVVCLGGDGVILHASNLFRSAVPPVVSFNLGSLGFLTAHPFENYKHDLRAIIHGNKRIEGVYVTLRMRLRCEILRDGQPLPGKVFEVLNEVVVDRGSNPYLCKIECYERNRLITKVQADGVLVATPTGSTAYSTSAGGSMVHPNVPCMLFTPICPHSLSFRPVILPDSAILELKVPDDARSSAFVSFDGKSKHPLKLGESIRIRMSEHPMSTVNKSDQTNDWFASLSRCFGWNQRVDQKSL